MAIIYNFTSSDCPAVLSVSGFDSIAAAMGSDSGTASASSNFAFGDKLNLRDKFNGDSKRLDLTAIYGGSPVYAIAVGLDLSATESLASVTAGHFLMGGIFEVPSTVTADLVVGVNRLWIRPDLSLIATLDTLTPPAGGPAVFVGAVTVLDTDSGDLDVDQSGVVFGLGTERKRITADSDAPTDTPPANIALQVRTLAGRWDWDGVQYTAVGAGGGGGGGDMLKSVYDPDNDGKIGIFEGGTGATTAAGARTALGLGTAATHPAGDFLQSANNLSDVASAAMSRANLGLVIGTDVQAQDAELSAIAGLTSAANKGIQFTAAGAAGTYDLTAAGKDLLDDADAAAQRTTLGLGTGATLNVAASGNAASGELVKGNDTRLTGGTGTVTSVSLSAPTGFSVSGSGGTTAVSLAITTTLSGILKGTGSGFAAATAGTDYAAASHTHAASDITSGVFAIARLATGTPTGAKFVRDDGTLAVPPGTGGGSGTVTSVGLSAPTGFSVSGSPVTASGTLALTTTLSGIIKGTGSGFTAATSGTDYGLGSVTSVSGAGGSTGLTLTGGPITGSGTLTLGGTLALASGGTGSTTASGSRTNLGLVIGTNVQAQDAELSAIASLTSAANKLPYFTGSGTASLADLSSAGRALIDDADASAQRTTLGLGTAATRDVPATGDASSSQVVLGSDSRLSGSSGPSVTGAALWSVDTIIDNPLNPGTNIASYQSSYAGAPTVLSTTQTLSSFGGDPRPVQYILQATGGDITITLPSCVVGKVLYFTCEIAGGTATITGPFPGSLSPIVLDTDDQGLMMIGADSLWRPVAKFTP